MFWKVCKTISTYLKSNQKSLQVPLKKSIFSIVSCLRKIHKILILKVLIALWFIVYLTVFTRIKTYNLCQLEKTLQWHSSLNVELSKWKSLKVAAIFFFIYEKYFSSTEWKVSKYGVISGPYIPAFELNTERCSIFPYSFRMWENTNQK